MPDPELRYDAGRREWLPLSQFDSDDMLEECLAQMYHRAPPPAPAPAPGFADPCPVCKGRRRVFIPVAPKEGIKCCGDLADPKTSDNAGDAVWECPVSRDDAMGMLCPGCYANLSSDQIDEKAALSLFCEFECVLHDPRLGSLLWMTIMTGVIAKAMAPACNNDVELRAVPDVPKTKWFIPSAFPTRCDEKEGGPPVDHSTDIGERKHGDTKALHRAGPRWVDPKGLLRAARNDTATLLADSGGGGFCHWKANVTGGSAVARLRFVDGFTRACPHRDRHRGKVAALLRRVGNATVVARELRPQLWDVDCPGHDLYVNGTYMKHCGLAFDACHALCERHKGCAVVVYNYPPLPPNETEPPNQAADPSEEARSGENSDDGDDGEWSDGGEGASSADEDDWEMGGQPGDESWGGGSKRQFEIGAGGRPWRCPVAHQRAVLRPTAAGGGGVSVETRYGEPPAPRNCEEHCWGIARHGATFTVPPHLFVEEGNQQVTKSRGHLAARPSPPRARGGGLVAADFVDPDDTERRDERAVQILALIEQGWSLSVGWVHHGGHRRVGATANCSRPSRINAAADVLATAGVLWWIDGVRAAAAALLSPRRRWRACPECIFVSRFPQLRAGEITHGSRTDIPFMIINASSGVYIDLGVRAALLAGGTRSPPDIYHRR
eukprot:gene16284-2990_t